MELSPGIYRTFVRPRWFSKYFFHKVLGDNFDFSHSVVLDFGCGIGSSSVMFPSTGYIGLDCDCKRITYAKRRYPNHRFIASKENKIPLPDKSVDIILIISVLHHIPSASIKEYLSEFSRVLKEGGFVFIVEPCLSKKTFICNWFMLHLDKGKYIRNEKQYVSLFKNSRYHIQVMKKFKQLLLYNKIFIIAKPCR